MGIVPRACIASGITLIFKFDIFLDSRAKSWFGSSIPSYVQAKSISCQNFLSICTPMKSGLLPYI